MEHHDDIKHRTDQIAGYFQGQAHAAFYEAQIQMLKGFEGLIETVDATRPDDSLRECFGPRHRREFDELLRLTKVEIPQLGRTRVRPSGLDRPAC